MKNLAILGLSAGAGAILALAILNHLIFNNLDIQPEGEWLGA